MERSTLDACEFSAKVIQPASDISGSTLRHAITDADGTFQDLNRHGLMRTLTGSTYFGSLSRFSQRTALIRQSSWQVDSEAGKLGHALMWKWLCFPM
jgi:hypothetical protein